MRGVALELERIAMHLGGLSGLATDIAFLQGGATYGRLRTTDHQHDDARLRQPLRPRLAAPGRRAVRLSTDALRATCWPTLAAFAKDIAEVNDLMLGARSVQSRFQGVGVVSTQAARELGLVGLAARASGVAVDTRTSLPGRLYSAHPVALLTEDDGDCWARVRLRMREIDESLRWLDTRAGSARALDLSRRGTGSARPARARTRCASRVREGWRGEVVHALETGRRRPAAALQGAGPVAAQLVRARARGARQRDLRLSRSATRASTSPTAGTISRDAPCSSRSRSGSRRAPSTSPTCARPSPAGFRGRRVIGAARRAQPAATACVAACPTAAIALDPVRIDLGRCVLCGDCAPACPSEQAHRSTTTSSWPPPTATGLVVSAARPAPDPVQVSAALQQRFGRSLKLRSVSAGGCNGCELELNALANVNFDIGRYGIDFVASPRHADGLVLTGPITRNMAEALQLCWDAMPEPKLVIAVGACAISGGSVRRIVGRRAQLPRALQAGALRARMPAAPADLRLRHPRPARHPELTAGRPEPPGRLPVRAWVRNRV